MGMPQWTTTVPEKEMNKFRFPILIGALLCCFAGAATWQLVSSIVIPSATAQETPKTQNCAWSYIRDNYSPELGTNGTVQMSADWIAMQKGGWHLITSTLINPNIYYVFERCQ